MFRLLLGVLLASAAMFGWGFYYWSMLPDQVESATPITIIGEVPKEKQQQLEAGLKVLPQSGTYYYPLPQEGQDLEEYKKAHQDGPIAMISYRQGGAEAFSPKTMGIGFAHFLVIALLAANLLRMAALRSYFSRLGFVFALGIFAAVMVEPGSVIWWHGDWQFPAYSALFHVSCALIMGVLLAMFVTPKGEGEGLEAKL